MVQSRIGDKETVGMMVRMSAALRDRIKMAAAENGRSQNSEILQTLEDKYPIQEISAADLAKFVHLLNAIHPDQKNELISNVNDALSGHHVSVQLEEDGIVITTLSSNDPQSPPGD